MECCESGRPPMKVLLAAGLATVTGKIPHPLASMVADVDPNRPDPEGHVITKALQQRVLPVVAHFAQAQEWNLQPRVTSIDRIWRLVNDMQFEELNSLAAAFGSQGIDIAILKGADLMMSVYPSDLARTMWDIDLLIRPTCIPETSCIMAEHGFVEAREVHPGRLWIEPISSTERSSYLIGPQQELPPCMRFARAPELTPYVDTVRWLLDTGRAADTFSVIGDEVFVLLKVGIHHNLAPQLRLTDVWWDARAVTLLNGAVVSALNGTCLTWYLASKFYRECMIGGFARLIQLLDLVAVVKHFYDVIEWSVVVECARRYGIEAPLFYTLSHLNDVLDRRVPGSIIELLDPSRNECGRRQDWGDFVPRLFGGVMVAPLF